MLLPLAALALGRTNVTMVTSRIGWERRAHAPPAEDAWILRCEGPLARRARSAPVDVAGPAGAMVVATVPAGARCRLRTATLYTGDVREPALAGACWVGFGQRLCAPRGFIEHFEFSVSSLAIQEGVAARTGRG